ncbi:Aspartate/methionine/tyrosine aminotransferase [Faunimonas pinastri]|uniref:aspartate transaminase n=1 Tax=Faunimonas pinastri TaxID=1855383 RepID=A0A1H9H2R1_9HYPH|nr:pyridoxal phosphate-dependent aminotransferase [Faunimonas pinastri]SEQ56664.1 Aspartate/methionine/tyrosine aminotransferase [Faunimonas pinastri]
MNSDLLGSLRREARLAPASGIVEVANYGRTRPGLIPLWVGEGDLSTPAFICEAAARSMAAGETFYTWQRGIPELRAALARYHERQFGRPFSPERFFVTGSGMQSIQLAISALAGPGDEAIVLTPAWPNFSAALALSGATVVEVDLDFAGREWTLDIDRLVAAVTPRTRVIFINSPANPTGWTAPKEQLRAILDLARERGIWIVADEVYNRFVFDAPRAASFYDVAEDDDRILYVNTFSKNWAMTGWRIGWISAPPALGDVLENLVQYSTSGVAAFMQRAAIAALDEGDAFVDEQVRRAAEGRRIICEALAQSNRTEFAWPAGAFYAFFALAGEDDTRALAFRLIDEAKIGIAPGTAFGSSGSRFMRLCFARRADDLHEVANRLGNWLGG